jgi:hypothetical protein
MCTKVRLRIANSPRSGRPYRPHSRNVLPKGQFVHTPAFVGCTYSERFVLLELTFISGRPKEKRLALLAALNRLVVEKVSLRPDDLVVLIYEMPGENISFGQGLAQRAHISA